MTENDGEPDRIADAAAALEAAEEGDDDARLGALERAHAALEGEIDASAAPASSGD